VPSTLPYRETKVGKYYLLTVEKASGLYRLYVGIDGKRYCHYDTGEFRSLQEALDAGLRGFDPTPFDLFPVTPFSKKDILARAPHGFDAERGDK
jgi:hypothetical protein